MTSFGRLKILKQVDDSETQSYAVFDPERGREILLHILPATRDADNRAFWERLEKALEAARKIVLERGDLLGVQYVITQSARKFEALINQLEHSTWESEAVVKPGEEFRSGQYRVPDYELPAAQPEGFAKTKPEAKAAPRPPAGQEGESRDGPGAFTRMFQTPGEATKPCLDELAATVEIPSSGTRVIESPRPGSLPNAVAPPGQFTQMFQAPQASPNEAPAPPAPASPSPGEFTRMFQTPQVAAPSPPSVEPPRTESVSRVAPLAPAARVPIPAAPAAPAPGEFTRIFQPVAPDPGTVRPAERNLQEQQPAPPPIAASTPENDPEKTKLFSRPAQAIPLEQAAPKRDVPGGFTDMFTPPSAPGSNSAQASHHAQGPTPPASSAQDSGFTRYFQDPLGKASADVDFKRSVPATQPVPQEPGSFTQMFGQPFSKGAEQKPIERHDAPVGATSVFSARPRTAPPVSQQPSAGPSDYTRMFQAPAPAAPSEQAAAHAAPQPVVPAKTAGPSVLIFVGIGVLAVLVIALVLFILLRH